MRQRKHPSPAPIYGGAGAWLLYCLAAPLYRWYHFAIGLALALLVFLVLRRFFPGTVETVEAPKPKPETGNPELDAALDRGYETADALDKLNGRIPDAQISEDLLAIAATIRKILAAVEEQPDKYGGCRRFLGYYPPTTEKLVRQYLRLQEVGAADGNIAESMEKIRTMLRTVRRAYDHQLDALYDRDRMDITAEIQVLEQMMAGDGLAGNNTKG